MEVVSKRIKDLQQQIRDEQKRISNCKHSFLDPVYDPEEHMEGYGSVRVGSGSDVWWDYAGYEKKLKPRWSRTCRLCGCIEYTYEQKPVISSYQPNFK